MQGERILPTPEEVPAGEANPDTQLHSMPGPAIETPGWVIASWQKAVATRRGASLADIVGEDKADEIVGNFKAQAAAGRQRAREHRQSPRIYPN